LSRGCSLGREFDLFTAMKGFYKKTEEVFESFSSAAVRVFSNPLTFIIAIIMVIIYLAHKPILTQSFHNSIYDIILCFTFLGFFIIQKAIGKYNAALNLKINELLSAHELASNRLVSIEKKSSAELEELNKHYDEIGDKAEKEGRLRSSISVEEVLEKKEEDKQDHSNQK
jgi:low affinity Fe/Cu permease